MSIKQDGWIETYSNRKVFPLDPNINNISIVDIAHALSHICRFNGHSKFFYSVAQHSINVVRILQVLGYDSKIQLYGLLHDASEAYICDMPRPIKQYMPEYKTIEEKIQNIIYQAVGLDTPNVEIKEIIKIADDNALMCEALTLMNNIEGWIDESKIKVNVLIVERDIKHVKQEFLEMAYQLILENYINKNWLYLKIE